MVLLSSSESLLIIEASMELLMGVCYLLMNTGKNTTTPQEKKDALNAKKAKLKARAVNKTGYRDLVMPAEVISLNIVENGISEELTKGDLKKAWERLERRWTLHEIPQLQARKHKAETYGLDNLHGKETS